MWPARTRCCGAEHASYDCAEARASSAAHRSNFSASCVLDLRDTRVIPLDRFRALLVIVAGAHARGEFMLLSLQRFQLCGQAIELASFLE